MDIKVKDISLLTHEEAERIPREFLEWVAAREKEMPSLANMKKRRRQK